MIHSVQLMLYVNDVEKIADFWKNTFGVKEAERNDMPDGSISVTLNITPQLSFVLFNKEFIRNYSDVANLDTPSVMLHTEHLNKVHKRIQDAGCFASEIGLHGGKRNFHFADPEQNYFAVSEHKVLL